MSLAFALLDFQHAGVRRRALFSADILQAGAVKEQYNTIQLYCLYVEKFAFWLVIYIKTFNTVNNKTSTTVGRPAPLATPSSRSDACLAQWRSRLPSAIYNNLHHVTNFII